MEEKPSAAQMFEYCPGMINLVGFPRSKVLDTLSAGLGQEVSLKGYQTEVGGRKVVVPSFPLKYAEERQEFFRKLPGERLHESLFEATFPRRENGRYSTENFLDFCGRVYETVESLKEELKPFGQLSETRRISKRVNSFDGELEATLRALKVVDESSMFAIDEQSGMIVNINEMPVGNGHYKSDNSGRYTEGVFGEVRVKMKKSVLEIARQGRSDFRKGIMSFVRNEFVFRPETDNLRADFERLAVPVRLHSRYKRLLDACEDRDERYEEDSEEFIPGVSGAVYPKFGKHYKIKNLFPPSLLNARGILSNFVPIDFETRSSERKFLLAGLHSGGKSFFLQNIVLASILGQVGESMPADSLVIPKYNRIFYYRNPENGGDGGGKLETEIGEIDRIIIGAQKDDLLVFDEFLDSTNTGVATWLCPEVLNRLGKLESTVFVSTHRNPNYSEFEEKGWVVMSPEHKIERGRVVPACRLKRGIPNERINRRYVHEKYNDILTG